jgi:acyl-CoA synthetase (AMP-forming)/AMP-acid ligase II
MVIPLQHLKSSWRSNRSPSQLIDRMTKSAWRLNLSPSKLGAVRMMSGELADRCSLNLVDSPYPPIEDGPYPALYEFLTKNWKEHGGYLKDQIAITDGSTGLQRTFHDHYVTSGSLAATLKSDMNISQDSTVALYCPNHVDYLPSVLAVSLCGAKLTPINPMFTCSELEVVLDKSRSSVLIAHISVLDTALESVKRCKHVEHVIVITDNGESIPAGTIDLQALRQHKDAFHETPAFVQKHTDCTPLILPYSSGTTGMPKAVCLTHGKSG